MTPRLRYNLIIICLPGIARRAIPPPFVTGYAPEIKAGIEVVDDRYTFVAVTTRGRGPVKL